MAGNHPAPAGEPPAAQPQNNPDPQVSQHYSAHTYVMNLCPGFPRKVPNMFNIPYGGLLFHIPLDTAFWAACHKVAVLFL